MRKILLTLFAMVVTASLQAITILWTLPDSNPQNSWVQTVMGTGKADTSSLGLYLVYAESTSPYGTAEEVWSATQDKSAKYVAGSTVGGAATINGVASNDVSFGFLEETASTSLVIEISSTMGFGAGNYYLVVFDPATSDSNAQYAVAQAKTFTGTNADNADNANGFYQTTSDPELVGPPEMGNFVNLEWMGGHWPAVPEPTALALLALGVAGLALRRKI